MLAIPISYFEEAAILILFLQGDSVAACDDDEYSMAEGNMVNIIIGLLATGKQVRFSINLFFKVAQI